MNAVRIPQCKGRPRSRPARLAADKGYSYPWIRAWLRRHKIAAVIPQRSDQQRRHIGRPLMFDKETYRRRNVIECCVGWLKECRRIATRFEKLALNFLAMIKVAIIGRYLSRDFPYGHPHRDGVPFDCDYGVLGRPCQGPSLLIRT